MPRKPISIEKLLQWTYREELPKADDRGGGLSSRWASLMLMGASSGASWAPSVNFDEPHPDAIRLDSFVRNQLPGFVGIPWPLGREAFLGSLALWASEDDPLIAKMRADPSGLVVAHARMGTRPHWDYHLRYLQITGGNGKPTVKGITPGRRYAIGAYCPLQIEFEPRVAPHLDHIQEIVCSRFNYCCWHAALVWLAETVRLDDFTVTPPAAASRPWLHDDEVNPIILPGPSTMFRKLPLHPTRKLTGPSTPRTRNSEVRNMAA